MGKAKHHRAAQEGDQQAQAALKTGIKEAPNELRRVVVGTDVEVYRDYLDMKDIPEENGLSNCGYLVLKKGEVVRILYIGSAKTEDEGWLYGEVKKSLPAVNAGRVGWLPATVAESPANTNVKATPQQAAAATGAGCRMVASKGPLEGRGDPGPPKRGTTTPSQATPVRSAGYLASASSSSQSAAPDRGNGGRATARVVSASDGRSGAAFPALPSNAFPALPGHTGQAPSWWTEEEEAKASPLQRPAVPPKVPTQPRDVEGAISRIRASAAAAVAKAEAKTKAKSKAKATKDTSCCPICVERYSAQRRHAQLPCCGVELCAVCAEKSLRSKRCYFCREDADEFPAMV